MSVEARTLRRAQQIIAEGLPIGPRMYPCVCRAGKHAHSGAAHTGGHKPTGCKRYRLDGAWDLAYRALEAQATKLGHSIRDADRLERDKHYKVNPRKDGEWSIGASDTSTCPRKIQYRNLPPDDLERAPEDQREARMGTIIHDEVTRRMKALYPWREFGGRILIPGLDRESEFDSYDPVTAELEDYKTAGDWRWDVLGDFGPEESTWGQVMLYAYALVASGRPVRTVKLSYIKRCNGHDETFVRPYDEQAAKAWLDVLLGYATRLDLIWHAIQERRDHASLDLPKTGTGPSSDEMCRRCFARLHCWNIVRAEELGRSPESLTILGEEPEDESVAWAVSEKVEAAAARLAAQKAEDATKVLLDGVEPGRYGDYEGYWSGGSSQPNWKEWAARLREAVAMSPPEAVAQVVEEFPDPEPRKYRYVRWGRVRKATLEREKRENPPQPSGDNVVPIRKGEA